MKKQGGLEGEEENSMPLQMGQTVYFVLLQNF